MITGFGRLGKPFGTDFFGVTPDIITVAKGLTGAVVPAGAVIAKTAIYDAIAEGAPAGSIEFMHGYTYSAHPLACAAGIAMLTHLTKGGLYERCVSLVPHFEDGLHSTFSGDPYVADVRNAGLMGAIQLKTPPGMGVGAFTMAVLDECWQVEGVYVRVSGESIAFSPAFVASPDEVSAMFEKVKRAIHAVAKKLGV